MNKNKTLAVAAMIAVVFVVSCSSGGPQAASRPGQGEAAQLVNGEAFIRVAADQAAFDAAGKAIAAKDQVGLRNLFSQGQVFMTKANTKVLVLDSGLLTTEVRIAEGPHDGKAVIVYAEWVVK